MNAALRDVSVPDDLEVLADMRSDLRDWEDEQEALRLAAEFEEANRDKPECAN